MDTGELLLCVAVVLVVLGVLTHSFFSKSKEISVLKLQLGQAKLAPQHIAEAHSAQVASLRQACDERDQRIEALRLNVENLKLMVANLSQQPFPQALIACWVYERAAAEMHSDAGLGPAWQRAHERASNYAQEAITGMRPPGHWNTLAAALRNALPWVKKGDRVPVANLTNAGPTEDSQK